MITELKITIFGSGGVGKSAITIQFIQNCFINFYDPTIEDGYKKQIILDGNTFLLNILDTSGQEEYISLRDQYILVSDGFLLVYSITNRESFEEIEKFKQKICIIKNNENIPLILCGNKSDLSYMRTVNIMEGNDMARKFKCPFFECSAKIRYNIDEIWRTIVREIIEKRNIIFKKKNKKQCLIL